MEWVVALLAIGCVFFAIQVIVDFVKHKQAIEPKIERTRQVKEQLQARIADAEAELNDARSGLDPARAEVQELEREYNEIHDEVEREASKQRPAWRPPRP